jgi:putative peptide zinc metalloprotease protein
VAGTEQEKARIRFSQPALEADLRKYDELKRVALYKKEHLTLKSPADGIVMSCPRVNEIGKLWDKGMDAPFCTVGDPTKLQAVVPVTPADISLLRSDQEYEKEHGRDLRVTMRVHGRDWHTWAGALAPLPLMEAKEVPPQLTAKAGGPLAIKPGQHPGTFVPQGQVFLVHIHFVDPDSAIYPGTLAQVKIHCQWRTAAWWVYRTIASTFDLKLM